jgi:hypothetical protein
MTLRHGPRCRPLVEPVQLQMKELIAEVRDAVEQLAARLGLIIIRRVMEAGIDCRTGQCASMVPVAVQTSGRSISSYKAFQSKGRGATHKPNAVSGNHRRCLGQIRVEMLRILSDLDPAEVRTQQPSRRRLCLESLSLANNANMQTSAVQRVRRSSFPRSTRGIPRTRFRISSGGTPVP